MGFIGALWSVACLRFSRMGPAKCQKGGEVTIPGLVESSSATSEWVLLVGAGIQGGRSGRSVGDSGLSMRWK